MGKIIDSTYEIIGIAGEGAMGRVYKAKHVQLKKDVALKILRPNLISDTTVVKRFEREAQAASRLNHPNCISMFGYGQDDDGTLLWMAMEFVQGRDLGTIIAEDSPLPAQRVLKIMSQVCDALDEAHSASIIHRDLKPANIVCFDHRRTTDFVKVLDFGIAKIMDSEDYQVQPLTREGIVCGTPAYMSPEQVQGLELDARSDLFSLGIILYQTLTGSLPFLGDSAVEVATKIVIEQPISPSLARSDWSYPPEFEEIVLKLLSKNREDRYSEAHEVRKALEACLTELQERRDASLDLRPDELAKILADVDDQVPQGTDTVRISDDLVAQVLMPVASDPAPQFQEPITPDPVSVIPDTMPEPEPDSPPKPVPQPTPVKVERAEPKATPVPTDTVSGTKVVVFILTLVALAAIGWSFVLL